MLLLASQDQSGDASPPCLERMLHMSRFRTVDIDETFFGTRHELNRSVETPIGRYAVVAGTM